VFSDSKQKKSNIVKKLEIPGCS